VTHDKTNGSIYIYLIPKERMKSLHYNTALKPVTKSCMVAVDTDKDGNTLGVEIIYEKHQKIHSFIVPK